MSTTKEPLGEAEKLKIAAEKHLDLDKLKLQFDISHFDLNAIFRGAQLTLVGGKGLVPNLPVCHAAADYH